MRSLAPDESDSAPPRAGASTPSGSLLRAEGPYATSNPFRFSTRFTDVETGLVYYGYRYYSPDLGRFINRDPAEEAGGVNLYGFVGNDPVNGWDVLGEGSLADWLKALTTFLDANDSSPDFSSIQVTPPSGETIVLPSFFANAAPDHPTNYNSSGVSVLGFISPSTGTTVSGLGPYWVDHYYTGGAGIPEPPPPTPYYDSFGATGGSPAQAAVPIGGAAAGPSPVATDSTDVGVPQMSGGQTSGAVSVATAGNVSTTPLVVTLSPPGYLDRYAQHVETYSITPNSIVSAGLIVGGVMPKAWVPWTGGAGPALGSSNPLTSVGRGLLGSNAVTTSAVYQGAVSTVAVTGAFIGGYNVGVLISGFVYAAFPGSNALPPPPPSVSLTPSP